MEGIVAEELLQSEWILQVLRIYLYDFVDITVDLGLITYQCGRALVQSWVTSISQFPKNVVDSLVEEFKHFFDSGPVPDDFDYSFLAM